MSVDVVGILTGLYQQTGSKYIKIPANALGSGPVQDALEQLLSGQLQIGSDSDNITFTPDPANKKVTIEGVGTLAPVTQIDIKVVFTGSDQGVEMDFTGTVKTKFKLSDAWPARLNVFPFNDVTITGGSLEIDVQPGASEVKLIGSVSSEFHDETLAVNAAEDGLFIVDFKQGSAKPTFAAGFVINGSWSPFTSPGLNLPTDFQNGFAENFELGLFFATLAVDDLSAFDNLKGDGKLFFLPDKIEEGITFVAGLQMVNNLKLLGDFFTGKPELDFTVTKGTGAADLDIKADLKDIELGTVTIDDFALEWQEANSEIDITATSSITAKEVNLDDLGICGGGSLFYAGATPGVNFDLVVGKCGDGTKGWVNPFNIPNLTIDDFGFDVGVTAEGQVKLDIVGQLDIGQAPDDVTITAAFGVAFDDGFPTPDGVVFEIKGTQKPVTLGNVISDVVSVFDQKSGFPKDTVLDEIVIDDIKLAVTQTTISLPPTDLEFDPFVSIRGDITLFGYNLDMMLAFDTNSEPPFLQACGTINHNGGPIVIAPGGIQLLKLSDSTGTKGPAACLDTKALTGPSTFCGGSGGSDCTAVSVPGNTEGYFLIADAAVEILGLADASVLAKLAKDSFEFDVEWNLFDTVSEHLTCTFDPKAGDFFAASEFDFKFPTDISFTVDGIHITIPFSKIIPSVSFCIAFGTFAPESVCGVAARGSGNPFFHFDFDFSWLGIDFDLGFDLDLKTVETALSDFGKFLENWLADPLKWGAALLELAKQFILRCLYAIGKTFEEAAQALANALGVAFEEIAKIAKEIWSGIEKCAQDTADALL